MKAIYIKPVTEKVNLHLKDDVNWGENGAVGGHTEHVVTANEDAFFDEEDYDDEYDPFFDD